MSTDNINQLLIRNINQFSANAALLVNIVDQGFISQYQQLNPQSTIHCFHNNFADFQQNKLLDNKKITCSFDAVYADRNKHDLIIIRFPKSKAEFNFTLEMLTQVVTDNTLILVVGENKSGVKTIAKSSKDYLNSCDKVDSARHCLLYRITLKKSLPQFNLADHFHYTNLNIANTQFTIASLPGVFSQTALDKGTEVLLNTLDFPVKGDVLDFGCGSGVIATFIGLNHPSVSLTLADVSALALVSAKETLKINQLTATIIATDDLSNITNFYDLVLSNPPFHQGLKTHYHTTESFLRNIKKHLKSNATIIIVANSFLKYHPIMETYIGNTKIINTTAGFSVYQSQKVIEK